MKKVTVELFLVDSTTTDRIPFQIYIVFVVSFDDASINRILIKT